MMEGSMTLENTVVKASEALYVRKSTCHGTTHAHALMWKLSYVYWGFEQARTTVWLKWTRWDTRLLGVHMESWSIMERKRYCCIAYCATFGRLGLYMINFYHILVILLF